MGNESLQKVDQKWHKLKRVLDINILLASSGSICFATGSFAQDLRSLLSPYRVRFGFIQPEDSAAFGYYSKVQD